MKTANPTGGRTRKSAAVAAVLWLLAALSAAAGEAPRVKDVRHVTVSPSEDRVLVGLNGFHPPQTFTIEGESLRVVSDFHRAEIDAAVPRRIEVNGGCIEQIRFGVHTDPRRKVRMVLNLKPGQEYEVDQAFFQKENLFALTIRRIDG